MIQRSLTFKRRYGEAVPHPAFDAESHAVVNMHSVTLLLLLANTAAMLVLAWALFSSGADPATGDLDTAAGFCIVVLYMLTTLPALLLLATRRAPRAALASALAFPAAFALVFTVVVIVFV